MTLSITETLLNASDMISGYERCIKGVPYEKKGILFSEMFFVFATLYSIKPEKILESGRARAQSTYLMGICFPNTKVVSIEHDSDSPDVLVAEKRLKGFANVTSCFGDSQAVIPDLMSQGDVAIIDGPKSFRAVRFALRLLVTGKTAAVFIHDLHQGLPERHFLDRHVPAVFFSDHPEFIKKYGYLDQRCKGTKHSADLNSWCPHHFGGRKQASYGYTLACLPYQAGCNYRALLRRLAVVSMGHKLSNSFLKRFGKLG